MADKLRFNLGEENGPVIEKNISKSELLTIKLEQISIFYCNNSAIYPINHFYNSYLLFFLSNLAY